MSDRQVVPVSDRFSRLLAVAPEVWDVADRVSACAAAIRAAMPRPFTDETASMLEFLDEVARRLRLLVQRPVDPRAEQGGGHTLTALHANLMGLHEDVRDAPEFDSPDVQAILEAVVQQAEAVRALYVHMTFYRVDEAQNTQAR